MDLINLEWSLRNDTFKGNRCEDILYLTEFERILFFVVFVIILTIAVIGNVSAIYTTIKRNYRFLQKSSIISLALSDLLMAIAYSINNLETFSHPLINWTLGSFMCSFIPMMQILGITASTCAMVIIAFDRYRSVVHALSKQWDPKPYVCIFGFLIMWLISAGLSYPIYEMFHLKPAHIIFSDGYEILDFCVSEVKIKLMTYYICMATLIFSTLSIVFFWMYYNIARLVWVHRKPPTAPTTNRNELSTETSITQVKSNDSEVSHRVTPIHTKQQKLHVERKIRTFKIIISLIFVFFVCRVPFWIFNILKLVYMYNQPVHWILVYVFNALALMNCALNPFLYTFLNPTLKVLERSFHLVADLTCKICCCCLSVSEFDELERDNPFVVEKCDDVVESPSPRLVGSCRVSKIRLGNVVSKQPESREAYREFVNY